MANKRRERNPMERARARGYAPSLRSQAQTFLDGLTPQWDGAPLAPAVLDLTGMSAADAVDTMESVEREIKREERSLARLRAERNRLIGSVAEQTSGGLDGVLFKADTFKHPSEWLSFRDALQLITRTEFDEVTRLAQHEKVWETTQPRLMVKALAETLHQYDVVLWEKEQWSLSRHKAEAWLNTPMEFEDLSAKPQLWVWNDPITLTEKEHKALGMIRPAALCSVGVMPVVKTGVLSSSSLEAVSSARYTPDMGPLGVLFWLQFSPELPPELRGRSVQYNAANYDPSVMLPILRFLPPIYHGEMIGPGVCELVAALFWLTLPLVERRPPHDYSRQQRRAYERKLPEHQSSVEIITLRKKDYVQEESGEGKATREVDWQWRWKVKPHWRKRRKDEEPGPPRWIEEYQKGPKNRPLKPQRDTMYHAKR